MTPNSSPDLHTAFPGQHIDLYGEAELVSVLEQNRSQGLAPDPEREQASSVLGQMAAEISTNTNIDPFASVNPAFQETVQRSHFAMRELLTPLGVDLPELSDFTEAGVNFSALAEVHSAMERLNMAPELVLAPTLSMDQWRAVYLNLQNSPRVNNNGRIKNGGLYIDGAIENHWDELMQHIASDDAHSLTAADDVTWQAVLIPGTEKPTLTKLDHNGRGDNLPTPGLEQQIDRLKANGVSMDKGSIHPTIPAYLSIQATKLHTLEAPLDSSTYTWLDGEFNEGGSLRAPGGDWNPDLGQVLVHWREVDDRFDSLGVRLPVWG